MKKVLITIISIFLFNCLIIAEETESKQIEIVRKTLASLAKKIARKPKDKERLLIQPITNEVTILEKSQIEDLTALLVYNMAGKNFRPLVAANEVSGEIDKLTKEDAVECAKADKAENLLYIQVKEKSNYVDLYYKLFLKTKKGMKSSYSGKLSIKATKKDGRFSVQKNLPKNNHIFLKYALLNHGRRVGNGQCWTLGEGARKLAGTERRGDRDWGKQVEKKSLLPGDLLEIDRGKETGHTAIIFSAKRNNLKLIHQNAPPYKSEMAVGVSPMHSPKKGETFLFHRPGLPWD